ncbi:MAG: ferredoxin [uncultured bacterium]|nr:MAG: ferredoxin [uncultured bacterium]
MRSQVIRAIGDGLFDIGSRDGLDLHRVSQVVLAGNTAMLALLSGRNADLLLQLSYWNRPIDCRPLETASWTHAWQIAPHGAIEVLPPVAGFVGSDLLAGVVATRLTQGGPGALLIDFGTNSEVALWNGTLNAKGQFSRSTPPSGFVLPLDGRSIALTKKDVDTFQRAKAAIGVAVSVLLAKAGMDSSQLRRVCIGGIFGQYLDIANAMEIGLLPSMPRIVETAGNTALAGCEAVLVTPEGKIRWQEAMARAATINLSACAEFDALFLQHLFLMPITGD